MSGICLKFSPLSVVDGVAAASSAQISLGAIAMRKRGKHVTERDDLVITNSCWE